MTAWCIVAKIKAKDGKAEDFVKAAKALSAAVNANEPGCLFYELHSTEDPLQFVFVERYKDEDAMKAHRGYPHFKELGRAMGEFMDGPPEIMRLPQV